MTDRPDFTESSDVVRSGRAQLEAGTTFTRSGESKTQSVGEVLLRVGVAPRTELRLGMNSYSFDQTAGVRTSGFEDASIGMKVRLLNGGGTGSVRPSMSVIVMTSLPTGASAFRQRMLQPGGKLTAAWDLTDRVSFSSNVNYFMVREPGVTSGEWASSGSVGVGLTEHVGTYVEYFGFLPTVTGASALHYANGGLTLGLGPNLQLDVRGGNGLRNRRGPDYFVGLGIARRW